MERIRFIEHRGRAILLLDLSGCSADEFLAVMAAARPIYDAQPPGSMRTLTLVQDAHYDRQVTDALREFVIANKPYVRASAVVGLNDLRAVVFNAINRITGRNIKAFDSVEKAKAWLALA